MTKPVQREAVYVGTNCERANVCDTHVKTLTVSVEPKPEQTAPEVWEALVKEAHKLQSTLAGLHNVRFTGFAEQKLVVVDAPPIDPVAEANRQKMLADLNQAIDRAEKECKKRGGGAKCYL
ncbi:MAG: hypothetical protein Q7T03_03240 [Deltaproteobacteria bacterium]|nr:hypothetical protein [Deltaproteobacteria bacterium]